MAGAVRRVSVGFGKLMWGQASFGMAGVVRFGTVRLGLSCFGLAGEVLRG